MTWPTHVMGVFWQQWPLMFLIQMDRGENAHVGSLLAVLQQMSAVTEQSLNESVGASLIFFLSAWQQRDPALNCRL